MLRRAVLAALPALAMPVPPTAPAAAADTPLWMTLPKPPAMPPAKRSGTIMANGVAIYRAVYGEGRPVILLHGGLGHSDIWGYQIPALAAAHEVVVIDSRGHGRSSRDTRPFGYRLMADDVLAVMDAERIDEAAIVGWSDGGIIGLDIAMRRPERVARLFAFGANADPSGIDASVEQDTVFNAYIERAGADYRRLSPTPDGYDAFLAAIAQMWASQPNWSKAELATINVPTVIADGEHDEAILPAHTRAMAEAIPGARLLILPKVSHFAMWQDPAGFDAALASFLEGW